MAAVLVMSPTLKENEKRGGGVQERRGGKGSGRKRELMNLKKKIKSGPRFASWGDSGSQIRKC